MVKKQYKLKKQIGRGAFGSVYKAKNLKTNEEVAIKMIKSVNRDVYSAKKVLRECIILRKLTQMKSNIYTSKIHEIILPEGLDYQAKNFEPKNIEYDLKDFDHIFLVLDLVDSDFKNLMEQSDQISIDETHVKTILYN